MAISYRYRHFHGAIIQHAVWLYCRFALSLRDVEELLAERGIEVSYETIRRWVARHGPEIAKDLRRQRPRAHPQWHLDEMFVSIGGRKLYLWRAVDQNGKVLDVLVQARRDKHAACRLLRKLLKKHTRAPSTIVTDKLQSYAAAIRALGLTGTHHQAKWKNNWIEGSHAPIRLRQRQMQGVPTPGSAQRLRSIHAVFYNHFNTRRHLIPAGEHRALRARAFKAWDEVVGAAA